MKLTISDRLNLASILPHKGNILEQMTTKDIIKKIDLTDEEKKAIELTQVGDRVTWKNEKAKEIEIDIELNTIETKILKDQVKILDDKKEITQILLPICLAIQELK